MWNHLSDAALRTPRGREWRGGGGCTPSVCLSHTYRSWEGRTRMIQNFTANLTGRGTRSTVAVAVWQWNGHGRQGGLLGPQGGERGGRGNSWRGSDEASGRPQLHPLHGGLTLQFLVLWVWQLGWGVGGGKGQRQGMRRWG